MGEGLKITVGLPNHGYHEGLTRRQQEVLNLLALGMSYREIGDKLTIKITTAKTHASTLIQELGVTTSMEAVLKGARMGLIDRKAVLEGTPDGEVMITPAEDKVMQA